MSGVKVSRVTSHCWPGGQRGEGRGGGGGPAAPPGPAPSGGRPRARRVGWDVPGPFLIFTPHLRRGRATLRWASPRSQTKLSCQNETQDAGSEISARCMPAGRGSPPRLLMPLSTSQTVAVGRRRPSVATPPPVCVPWLLVRTGSRIPGQVLQSKPGLGHRGSSRSGALEITWLVCR